MEEFLRVVAAGGTPLIGAIGWVMWKLHLKLVDFDKRLVRIETLLNNHLKHLNEEEKGR